MVQPKYKFYYLKVDVQGPKTRTGYILKGERKEREESMCYINSQCSVLKDYVTNGPTENHHGLVLFYCVQFPWFLQVIKQVVLDNNCEHLKVQIYTSFSNYMHSSSVILQNVSESFEKYQEFGRPRNTSISPLRFNNNSVKYFVAQILLPVLI